MSNLNDLITNRSEILFLYDVSFANPNGDPDENRPRIDDETGLNYVTDVRLKRTIRDYLKDYKGKEIFVSKLGEDKETLSASERYKREIEEGYNNLSEKEQKEKSRKEYFLEKFIDLRLFGSTITIKADEEGKNEQGEDENKKKKKNKGKGSSLTLTGPVQFKFGRSLHKVEVLETKGSTTMASDKGKKAGTFSWKYDLPYSLICFYGIINENAAKDTHLTNEDVRYLIDGLWNGTKNLITRSKMSQLPRLLIKINYKENNYHIGGIDDLLSIKTIEKDGKQIEDKEIRKSKDFTLILNDLLQIIENNQDKIETIEYIKSSEINLDKELKDHKFFQSLDENNLTD